MRHITIGFSIHRPEIISITADLMREHEAIFLEEPPQSGFQRMLAGTLTIEDYLLPQDIEYPYFSRRMCRLMRALYADGTKIIQVEPFLEHLQAVHDFFAKGHRPEELESDSIRYQVYAAERAATGALLNYYKSANNGSFEAVIEATIRFARADAARFKLRDSLRARVLADLARHHESAFIEAGSIHLRLYSQLKSRISDGIKIKSLFVAHKILQTLGKSGHLYGPGDQLTLLLIFHPGMKVTPRTRLLAARSLIYSKIVEKEELTADLKRFPHIRNEMACIRIVKVLTMNDCARLFSVIRRTKTVHARKLVTDYLARFKKIRSLKIADIQIELVNGG